MAQSEQQKPVIKAVEQFANSLNSIHGLSFCPDGLLLLKDGNLEYMKQTGENLKVQSCSNVKVLDIAVHSTNNILLSFEGETVPRVLNVRTGQILNSNFKVAPLIIHGIHVTREQKVIVGCVTREPWTSFTSAKRQVVIVMDEEGNLINQYEFDQNKKALFTDPYRITSTKSGNIGVVDVLDTFCIGRIVVLRQTGSIQIYNGHPHVNSPENPFNPRDILTTPTDNIVVTDCINHTLHILSCDGVFITFLMTNNVGIHLPYSLACSGPENFYIGCSIPEGIYSSMCPNLFKVQYSGF